MPRRDRLRRHPGHAASLRQATTGVTAAMDTGSVGRRTLSSSEAADFSLRDQHGRSIQLSAQRGKLVLLTFLLYELPGRLPADRGEHQPRASSPGPEARRCFRPRRLGRPGARHSASRSALHRAASAPAGVPLPDRDRRRPEADLAELQPSHRGAQRRARRALDLRAVIEPRREASSLLPVHRHGDRVGARPRVDLEARPLEVCLPRP